MTELANLPALTAEELVVLAEALMMLGSALDAHIDIELAAGHDELARRQGLRRAVVRSLMTAVAEARYSLRDALEPQGPGQLRRPLQRGPDDGAVPPAP